jgi:hypothetical protein
MDGKELNEQIDTAERAIALEDYKLNSQEGLERLKYQVEYSQSALRNLQLVNGGAIIALLTFIGNVEEGIDRISILWSFIWFSIGLVSSLASYLGAYISQARFMDVAFLQAWQAQHRAQGSLRTFPHDKEMKCGNLALAIGIVLAVLSVLCFMIGAFVAIEGLK